MSVMVPPDFLPNSSDLPLSFWLALQQFREQFEVESQEIEPEIFEDGRDRSPGREVELFDNNDESNG